MILYCLSMINGFMSLGNDSNVKRDVNSDQNESNINMNEVWLIN